MSEAPRGIAVRPARVWQATQTLQGNGSAGGVVGFTPSTWAKPLSQGFALQTVKELTSLQTPPAEMAGDAAADSSATEAPSPTAPETAAHSPDPHAGLSEEALENIRREAYARGLEAGKAEMREEMTATLAQTQQHDEALVAELLVHLTALRQTPQELFEPLKRLALHLAEQLVLAELTLEPMAIERLVQRCVEELANKNGSAVVATLNSVDMASLQAIRDRTALKNEVTLRLESDDSLLPGSVKVRADDANIEDLLEHRIESLVGGLLVDNAKWRKHTGFQKSKLYAEPLSADDEVMDAQPRMASTAGYDNAASDHNVLNESLVDELLDGEDLGA